MAHEEKCTPETRVNEVPLLTQNDAHLVLHQMANTDGHPYAKFAKISKVYVRLNKSKVNFITDFKQSCKSFFGEEDKFSEKEINNIVDIIRAIVQN
jgi:hypothetical protein